MLLEGTFVFCCLIVWRLDRRLLTLAWVSLAVAVITGGAWLVIVAANMSGMPATSVLQAGVVKIVLTQTHFGIAWLVRLALAIVVAVALLVQARTGKKDAAAWAGLVASFGFIAALAWAGHGAAGEDVPFDWLHAPADVLHLLASGAWLGALVPLVIFLSGALRDADAQAVAAARAATQRFSVLGLCAVGILIVTGTINTWFLAGSVPALLGTLYGQLLLAKIALFLLMIAAASVNQRRLVPYLADAAVEDGRCVPAIAQVRLNAAVEAGIGVFVLVIVGVMGILPPGAHTEPHWPLPFRIDLSELSPAAQELFDAALAAFVLCLIGATLAANKKRYRITAGAAVLAVAFCGACLFALRPGIVEAYPTSFYASPQAYAAPSIARGAPLYMQQCVACHGVDGRGEGPLAARLPVHPADLTESHLFAHKVGEMYWWISNGKGGVMPGFAGKLSSDERWDVINFVLARAAGDETKTTGSAISSAGAVPLPDFAFEQNGSQNTLSQMLKSGPVLVVLTTRGSDARLGQLAKLQPRFVSAGLRVIAVDLRTPPDAGALTVRVSKDVREALALFRSPGDGDETELMLDRGGNVRARWTAAGSGGLADAATLLADAARVATTPAAAVNHAGHGG